MTGNYTSCSVSKIFQFKGFSYASIKVGAGTGAVGLAPAPGSDLTKKYFGSGSATLVFLILRTFEPKRMSKISNCYEFGSYFKHCKNQKDLFLVLDG